MAKRFGGFTPQQQQTLLSKMGYTGPAQQDDINKFMMSSPKAASMMGRYAQMAKARVEGGPQTAMQVGGYMAPPTPMQQMQERATNLDYNRLYAQPNQQPMQQPMMGYAPGGTVVGQGGQYFIKDAQGGYSQPYSTALDAYYAKKGQTTNPTTGAAANTTPNTTGGFDMGAGQQGQGNMVGTTGGTNGNLGTASDLNKGAGGYASADMQPIYDDAGNIIGYGPSVYQPGDWYTKPGERPISGPGTSQPSLYSGDITNQTLQDIMKMSTGSIPVDLQYDYNRDGKITSDDALQASKVGIGQGTISSGTDAGGFYDPSQGLPTQPEALPEANFYDGSGYVVPNYAEKKLTDFANEGKDFSNVTIEGKQVVFSDGSIITADTEKGAELIANAAKKYHTDVVQPYNAAQDMYKQQLGQYQDYYRTQAGTAVQDPETIRANLNTAQQTLGQEQGLLQQYTNQLANMDPDDPQRATLQGLIDEQQIKVTQARAGVSTAQTALETVGMPSTTELRSTALDDPMSMVTKADVVTVSEDQRAAGKIAEGTGQAPADAVKAQQTIAKLRADVPLAKEFEAAGMTTAEAAAEVADVMSKLTAVTGKPSAEALADAATMDPQQLAQLGLTVEQIDRARRVEAIPALEVTPEMEVTGAVDMERAKAETNFAAATGVPSTEATVQGQLTQLMEQFEDGETPAWAAGAMRAATQRMAARGLSASSMAGQAIVQAAMESALPIAQMDAQTRAQFEAQNLSNRQQAAMFAAEQRSKFLGMEFDQEFQARVQNAARIADVAQINFTAEQQVALENARMAQTVDIANLDAKNAKIMADAAAMSQLDLTNLNNRQQANVQRAKAFLDFDMSSMTNQQQVAMFKAQSLASVYMSDTAAENAARQFNASSQDQVGMFFSNLQTQIQQFNNEQANAMEKFNAGEANAISQFNAAQQNARDQFNASQALVVEQANTQWEQAITTMDNAAQNQANRDAAIAANGYTETTYNNMLQQERDVLDYAWRSADNALQRENSLLMTEMQTQASVDQARGEGTGILVNTALDFVLKKLPI